jgi:hypothetical protein
MSSWAKRRCNIETTGQETEDEAMCTAGIYHTVTNTRQQVHGVTRKVAQSAGNLQT